eukprot:2117088-Amphidinium_carterae.2
MHRVRNKFAVPVRIVGALTETERESVPGAACGPHVVGEASLVPAEGEQEAEAAPAGAQPEVP